MAGTDVPPPPPSPSSPSPSFSLPSPPPAQAQPGRVQVNGLVNGYTATNLSIPLASKGAGLWQGVLNVANQFPDLNYATGASLAFCNANKANIQASCSSNGASLPARAPAVLPFGDCLNKKDLAVLPSEDCLREKDCCHGPCPRALRCPQPGCSDPRPGCSDPRHASAKPPSVQVLIIPAQGRLLMTVCVLSGASFSNSNTLLNACSQFLTNGEVSAAADPQQVSVACSVAAVQVSA